MRICKPVCARTLIIDDMVHGPAAVEVDAEWLVEIVCQMRWCNNSCFDCHSKVTEVVVNTNSVCHMLLDVRRHAVASNPSITVLRGNIVRQLNLQKVTGTTFTIPLDLILQRVFGRETKHCHIVTIDHQPVLTRVVP